MAAITAVKRRLKRLAVASDFPGKPLTQLLVENLYWGATAKQILLILALSEYI
jgi:hypothetical protein